jgi:threonyl-tRNA synthetase
MLSEVEFQLPDGNLKRLPADATGTLLLENLSKKQAKRILGVRVDGRFFDLHTPLGAGGSVEFVDADDAEALDVVRHSTAHIMAAAVQELFPGTQVTIGPETAEGFYYDFHRDEPFTPEDFAAIEKHMAGQVKGAHRFDRTELSAAEAIDLFRGKGEAFKVELIEDLVSEQGVEQVSLYRHGEWLDLCRGPHVPHTGWVKAFKLMKTAGAYWRGDEHREQLQRIYGTAFLSKADLQAYLERLAEAERRDHRRLGREMELFFFDAVAPAMPFFMHKGAFVYNRLVDYVRSLYERYGYDEVVTPQILDLSLWKQSGHWDKYRDNLFFCDIDEREFAVKPMNCPGHTLVFRHRLHSYRDLPVRMADFGRLHRYERSGVTAGLTRVRSFAQDDAHIFCRADQISEEVEQVIDMCLESYERFGFEGVQVFLSTRPEVSIGEDDLPGADALWTEGEAALKASLDAKGQAYTLAEGDGAFYGPKIDFAVKDALGREWQLGTIQADFMLPLRFDLEYVGADGARHRPVMIHRAMLGSLERFLGVYLEHCAGQLPTWLAPIQARVITVSEKSEAYGGEVLERLQAAGLRVDADFGADKLDAKIRVSRPLRIPYLLIVGERDLAARTVSPRLRDGSNQDAEPLDAFVERLSEEALDPEHRAG